MRQVLLIVVNVSVHITETIIVVDTTEHLQVSNDSVRKRTYVSTRRVSRRPINELQMLTHLQIIILTEDDTVTGCTVTTELHITETGITPDEETVLIATACTVTYLKMSLIVIHIVCLRLDGHITSEHSRTTRFPVIIGIGIAATLTTGVTLTECRACGHSCRALTYEHDDILIPRCCLIKEGISCLPCTHWGIWSLTIVIIITHTCHSPVCTFRQGVVCR